MTQHRLKLHIAKHIPDDPGIVGTRTVTLRERIMRKLLGRKQRVTSSCPATRSNRSTSPKPTTI